MDMLLRVIGTVIFFVGTGSLRRAADALGRSATAWAFTGLFVSCVTTVAVVLAYCGLTGTAVMSGAKVAGFGSHGGEQLLAVLASIAGYLITLRWVKRTGFATTSNGSAGWKTSF